LRCGAIASGIPRRVSLAEDRALRGSLTLNGQPLHSKRTIQLQAGDHLVLETPGGGGYGDPAERLESAHREDLKNGYVTA